MQWIVAILSIHSLQDLGVSKTKVHTVTCRVKGGDSQSSRAGHELMVSLLQEDRQDFDKKTSQEIFVSETVILTQNFSLQTVLFFGHSRSMDI